jgi:hypothetical protein
LGNEFADFVLVGDGGVKLLTVQGSEDFLNNKIIKVFVEFGASRIFGVASVKSFRNN